MEQEIEEAKREFDAKEREIERRSTEDQVEENGEEEEDEPVRGPGRKKSKLLDEEATPTSHYESQHEEHAPKLRSKNPPNLRSTKENRSAKQSAPRTSNNSFEGNRPKPSMQHSSHIYSPPEHSSEHTACHSVCSLPSPDSTTQVQQHHR